MRSRSTRRSSRSRPTRSMSSCPRRRRARSAEILVEEGETVDGRAGDRPHRRRQQRAGAARRPASPPAGRRPQGNGAHAAGRGRGAAAPSPADGASATVDVLTPAAGESVSEGTILEWHVKVGEQIKADDDDRRDLDRQGRSRAALAGYRDGQRALVAEGDTVTVGQVIARIAVGAGTSAPAPAPAPSAPSGQSADATSGARASAAGARRARRSRRSRPAPRRSRASTSAAVSGSGPAGRITKSDVLSAARGQRRARNGAGDRARRRPEPSR